MKIAQFKYNFNSIYYSRRNQMKKTSVIIFVFMVFILLVNITPIHAAVTAKLKAEVYTDQGQPVKGAKVIITFTRGGQGRTFTSNKKGKIFSPFIDVGTYNMSVNYEGYYLSSFTIKIRNRNQDVEMNETRKLGPNDAIPPIRFQADRLLLLRLIMSKKVIIKRPKNKKEAMERLSAPKKLKNTIEEVKGLYQIGKLDEALNVLNKKLKKFPNESSLFYLKGLILYKKQNNIDAIAAFNKSLELNPKQFDSNYYLGEIAYQMKDIKSALAYYEKELSLDPKNVVILIKVGLIAKRAKDYDKAINYFEKVIEINPNEMRAQLELAEVYQAHGDMEKAKTILSKLEKSGVKDAKSYFNQGVGYWNSKDYNLAMQSFKQASLIDPHFALAYKQIGFCFVKLNEPKEAISALNKYVSLNSQGKDIPKIKELINKLQKAIK